MSHKFISLLLLFGIIAFSSAFEYPPAPAPAPALVPPTVERPGISIVLVLFAIFGGLAVVAAVLFVFINWVHRHEEKKLPGRTDIPRYDKGLAFVALA
jgi:hypothetical protein